MLFAPLPLLLPLFMAVVVLGGGRGVEEGVAVAKTFSEYIGCLGGAKGGNIKCNLGVRDGTLCFSYREGGLGLGQGLGYGILGLGRGDFGRQVVGSGRGMERGSRGD